MRVCDKLHARLCCILFSIDPNDIVHQWNSAPINYSAAMQSAGYNITAFNGHHLSPNYLAHFTGEHLKVVGQGDDLNYVACECVESTGNTSTTPFVPLLPSPSFAADNSNTSGSTAITATSTTIATTATSTTTATTATTTRQPNSCDLGGHEVFEHQVGMFIPSSCRALYCEESQFTSQTLPPFIDGRPGEACCIIK